MNRKGLFAGGDQWEDQTTFAAGDFGDQSASGGFGVDNPLPSIEDRRQVYYNTFSVMFIKALQRCKTKCKSSANN